MSQKANSSSKTIKGLADVIGGIGIGLTITGGGVLAVLAIVRRQVGIAVVGILVVLIGSWLIYAISRILYGFGELVGNSEKAAHYLQYLCANLPKEYMDADNYGEDDVYDENDDVSDDSVE